MMKKCYFSAGIYREGMRQLRIFGILATIACLGITMIPLLLNTLNSREVASFEGVTYTDMIEMENVAVLFLVFGVAVPFMTLYLFSFLNKRNKSDFYFSAPHSRLEWYGSYSLAVLTWAALMILAILVGMLIPVLAFPKDLEVDTKMVVRMFLLSSTLCLQIMGGILLAMTWSGTLFSNLMLTAAILIGPRMLFFLILLPFQNDPVLILHLPSFLDFHFNGLFHLVFCMMGYAPVDEFQNSSILYSLVLGIGYLVLGGYGFQRRKSETSGKNAPTEALQTVICGIVMTIVGATGIVIAKESVIGGIGFYAVMAIVYFVLALFMTRNLKASLRAYKGLVVALVLNLVMLGGVQLGIHRAYAFQPEPEEIESVALANETVADSFNRYYNNDSDYVSYAFSKTSGNLTSPELLAAISEELKTETDILQSDETNQNFYDAIAELYGSNMYRETTTFAITTKHGVKYRKLRMSGPHLYALQMAQKQLLEQETAWRTLPNLPDTTSIYRDIVIFYNKNGEDTIALSAEDERQLLETLREELQTCDINTWSKAYLENAMPDDLGCGFHYINENGKRCYLNVSVYEAVAPKTVALYKERQQQALQTEYEALQTYFATTDISQIQESHCNAELSFVTYDAESGISSYYDPVYDLSVFAEVVKNGVELGDIDHCNAYVRLEFYDYESTSFHLTLPLKDDFPVTEYLPKNSIQTVRSN